jgi:hypothetical protein
MHSEAGVVRVMDIITTKTGRIVLVDRCDRSRVVEPFTVARVGYPVYGTWFTPLFPLRALGVYLLSDR